MTNNKPKQTDRVLKYMQDFGSITQRDALNDLGVYRLASRINELKRQGYPISREMETVRNRYDEPSTIARYSLKGGEDRDPEGMH